MGREEGMIKIGEGRDEPERLMERSRQAALNAEPTSGELPWSISQYKPDVQARWM